MFEKLTTFIREARVELKKVNWPTKQQTINYTAVVIGLSVAVGIFLGGLDYVFREIVLKSL
ncbi:preprotein translocase subunit SecE [Patescibacteria group bacterium]|nr:MAG: preprotein translocase subunit SecE [Patescibacteria group bacterium]